LNLVNKLEDEFNQLTNEQLKANLIPIQDINLCFVLIVCLSVICLSLFPCATGVPKTKAWNLFINLGKVVEIFPHI